MTRKNNLIKLGFQLKNDVSGIFLKRYPSAKNYLIEVNLDAETVDYGTAIVSGSQSTISLKTPESWVVLECVDRLLIHGYQPKNIVLEKTWPTGHGTSGRLDILVLRDDGSSYMMIECKTYGAEFEKAYKKLLSNGGQLFTYFQQDKQADVLMLYASEFNSKSNVIYRNEIVNIEDDYRDTSNVRDFYDRWNKLTKKNGVFDDWVKPYNFQSKAITPRDLKEITQADSGFIFNRFLEILRHNVVSDQPNAFNKIFTLFLCKIYDEKSTKANDELAFQWFYTPHKYEGISYPPDDNISFQKRLTDLYKKGMFEFLGKNVTDISDAEFGKKYASLDDGMKEMVLTELTEIRLKKNNEFAIKEVFDDDSFSDNAKVVKEVVELLQGFKIRYTEKQQYLSDFFELLLTTGLKQQSGQFFTPVPVAQFIIKSLPLENVIQNKLALGEGDNLLPTVIDYAAGSGHFITESMHEIQRIIDQAHAPDYIDSAAKKIKTWQNDKFDWADQYVYGIEKDYRLVKVSKVGCYLHGDGIAQVIHGDGLANFRNSSDYKGLLKKIDKDFPRENKQFDILVSNPPYSVSAFKNDARKHYTESDFALYDRLTDQSSEIECLFVERMQQLLKDGGMAGIILPSSMLSNSGIYTAAREIILRHFEIIAIAELGSNTFLATGTNTAVLFLRRRNNYDGANIYASVSKAISSGKDVTLNQIEKAVSKYVAHVWGDISFQDYVTLLQRSPNKIISTHNIFREYQKLNAKNKINLETWWSRIIDLETDKLFHFVLAYKQKVVLVKTGKKSAEKQFLGYVFSKRRGDEGIHPIERGKSIDECTRLFDPNACDNPKKASTYIYQAFLGDYDSEIDKDLSKNISRADLIDMLTFDRSTFEKNISLSVKKKVSLKSKWPAKKLGELALIVRGASPRPIKQFITEAKNGVNWIKIGDVKPGVKYISSTKEKITREGAKKSRAVIKGDLILSNSMSFGRPYIMDTQGCIHDGWLLLTNFDPSINKEYLYLVLSHPIAQDQFESAASGGTTVDNLNIDKVQNVKVPVPPLAAQIKIVKEIAVIEKDELSASAKLEKLKLSHSKILRSANTSKKVMLNEVADLKKGTSITERKTVSGVVPVIAGGQSPAYFHNKANREGNIIAVSASGAYAGYLSYWDAPIFASDCITIKSNDENLISTKLIYLLLKDKQDQFYALQSGQAQPHIYAKDIETIQIPIPSIASQAAIFKKLKAEEVKINAAEMELSKLKNEKLLVLRKLIG